MVGRKGGPPCFVARTAVATRWLAWPIFMGCRITSALAALVMSWMLGSRLGLLNGSPVSSAGAGWWRPPEKIQHSLG